jgi:chlorite dismutase
MNPTIEAAGSKPQEQKDDAKAKEQPKLPRQYVSFVTYKVDPQWYGLEPEQRELNKREFEAVIEQFARSGSVQILSYSTVGMRADADMLLWLIAYKLEPLQELATAITSCGMGRYLHKVHSFLSMTKRSLYMDRFHPTHPEDRVHLVPGKYNYFFVYPFVKSRQWYLLPLDERQKLMDEHIKIGMKYPSVKLNTTYSFGLDDQDFVVAFESDSPQDFLDLVQELRESQGSLYTVRDTPIITGVAKDIRGVLNSLGG